MTTVAPALGLPKSRLHMHSDTLNTLRNPRSPTDEFPSPNGSSSSSPHPDLNGEVATLSNKLISAINHQTHLDDALAATLQELESLYERNRKLESENQEHARLIATGALVEKAEVESQAGKLLAKLAEERKRRTVVERDKKGIEQELENLTTALFEEANEMVAAARKEKESFERRNEQLRTQLQDTELLLASHQEQLAELKMVIEQLQSNREISEAGKNGFTAPPTPALPHGNTVKSTEGMQIATFGGTEEVCPGPPTSFSHLLSPVLRMDLQSYEDFRSLLDIAKKSAPSSRVNSGSFGGVNIPGLSPSSVLQSNNSTAPQSNSPQLPGQAPLSTPGTVNAGLTNLASPVIPLKETKFYKRALTEDIEPTLRLDTAPGLSWLARRTVINSMCEGSLVVEPMPSSNKMSVFSCALCGENRKGDEFTRTHRFRTSESENAQRYPLCAYCLNRVRASCDYLGFLRMIKDGHWRTDGAAAEKSAWEESVRLRERMFWARIGGGVIPAIASQESLRTSSDETKPKTPFSAPPFMKETSHPERKTLKENDGPFGPRLKSNVSTNELASRKGREQLTYDDEEDDWETAKQAAIFDDSAPSSAPTKMLDASGSKQLRTLNEPLNHTSLRESLKPRPRSRAASYEKERTATPDGQQRRPSPHSHQASTPQRSPKVSQAPDSQSKGDQGLQISIPGFI